MITIVDYHAGNLTSVQLAFAHLGVPSIISADPNEVLRAERIVFPGVGAAGAAMRHVAELGLEPALRQMVERGTPFMGMCLGAQIILDHSEEDGGVDCLGLLPGQVRRFQPLRPETKIPHMGWNSLEMLRPHPILEGIPAGSEFYFVHSYYPAPSDAAAVVGQTDYDGMVFASMLSKDNLVVTQFHPEKSGRIGLRILENFSRWDGSC